MGFRVLGERAAVQNLVLLVGLGVHSGVTLRNVCVHLWSIRLRDFCLDVWSYALEKSRDFCFGVHTGFGVSRHLLRLGAIFAF